MTDSSLADWEIKVVTQGQDVQIQTTETYTVDPKTGALAPSSSTATLTEMIPMVVQYKVGADKVTAIAYPTEYRENPTLPKGTQVLVTVGKDGSSRLLASYQFIQDGANSYFANVQYGNPVIVAAQNKIIEVGTYVAPVIAETPETPVETPEVSTKPKVKPQAVVVEETKKEILTVVTTKTVESPVKEAQLPTTGDNASSLSAIVSSSLLIVTGLALSNKSKKDRN